MRKAWACARTRAYSGVAHRDRDERIRDGFALVLGAEARAGPCAAHTVVFVFRGLRPLHDGQGQLRLPERARPAGRERDAAAHVAVLHRQLAQHLPNRPPAQGRVLRAALLSGNFARGDVRAPIPPPPPSVLDLGAPRHSWDSALD